MKAFRLCAILMLAGLFGAQPARAQGRSAPTTSLAPSCVMIMTGVDTSRANVEVLSYSGKSLAQVFAATDILISAITVWRPASEQGFAAGMHLYICGVDSNLTPQPATEVLLDGPTVQLLVAGPTAVPIRYNFDPPFALPSRGHFALAIKEEDPFCSNIIPLLADSTKAFPDGHGWLIHPFADCHSLGSHADPIQDDLVFIVEFCRLAVPATAQSWGRVKAMYR